MGQIITVFVKGEYSVIRRLWLVCEIYGIMYNNYVNVF